MTEVASSSASPPLAEALLAPVGGQIQVVRAEFLKGQNRPCVDCPIKPYITVKETKNLLKIPCGRYFFKDPKLSELYEYALGQPMENAHNSNYDVMNLHKAIQMLYNKQLFAI